MTNKHTVETTFSSKDNSISFKITEETSVCVSCT